MSKSMNSHGAKLPDGLPAFPAYFASSQRSVDIFQSLFILTLGQACQFTRILQIAVCAPAPSAAPDTLSSGFRCDDGPFLQGFWVLARFPWLAWVHARDFCAFDLLWTVLFQSVILVAAILQPRWYLQGGRAVLHPLLHTRIAGLAFLEMLLAPSNLVLLATAPVCYLGSKGIMFLFFTVLCKNFPLRLHALTCACSWLFMALHNIAYCYKHGGSMPGVLVNILTAQLVIEVVVPVLVARLQTRSLWARYHALQVHQSRETAPQAAHQATPKAAPKAAPQAAPQATPKAAPEAAFKAALYAAFEAAPEAGSHAPGNQAGMPMPAAAQREEAAAAPVAEAQESAIHKRMYRPICDKLLISVKIHHRAAFDNRHTILAAIEEHLHTSCSPPTPSTPTTSTPTTTAAAPRTIQSIASVAIPGCLQLILSVTGLSPPRTSCSASPREEGGGLAAALYDSLPAACRTGRVTVQVGLTATYFSPLHCSIANGDINAALCCALPPLQQQQQQVVAMEALVVQPMVLQSGLAEAQVVEVQLPGSCAGGGLKVVAVAVAVGRQVHTVEEVAAAAGTCRLTLPPGLDPGPVALHAISAEGLLLASCCTAALPPPAAQELHQLLRECTADSGSDSDGVVNVRAELEAVLEDLAAVWQLSRSGGGGAVEAGDLIAYFRDNDLGSCKAALEQQLHLSPPPQHEQHLGSGCNWAGGSCSCFHRGSGQAGAGAVSPSGQSTPCGVGAGSGKEVSFAQCPSHLGSMTAATVFLTVCGGVWASLYTRRALVGQAPRQTAALIVVHSLLMIGPHLWVAVWGPMRARRGTVVVLQTAANVALYLAPVLSPAMSCDWVVRQHVPSQLLVEGVMRPAINQVPWRLQLLMTACELVCMAVGCRWGRPDPGTYGMQACRPVSLPWFLLIALTAGTVSVLVQRLPGGLARPSSACSNATVPPRYNSG